MKKEFKLVPPKAMQILLPCDVHKESMADCGKRIPLCLRVHVLEKADDPFVQLVIDPVRVEKLGEDLDVGLHCDLREPTLEGGIDIVHTSVQGIHRREND